jgi:tRNA threonylcarbamoyladenosine biosynthesis protein TsaB
MGQRGLNISLANLLAIDASTHRASVALSWNGQVFSENIDATVEHARLLLPMIERLLKAANMHISLIDGIAFGCGPGSFTGLRIACSVAKGLAFAHDLPLYPVSGLFSIAAQVFSTYDDSIPVLSMLDARMNQVYWAYYPGADDRVSEHVDAPSAVNFLTTTPFIIAGVGLDSYILELPDALQKCALEHRVVFPDARMMINCVQSCKISAVDSAAAAPVYIRNHVTQGVSRG